MNIEFLSTVSKKRHQKITSDDKKVLVHILATFFSCAPLQASLENFHLKF